MTQETVCKTVHQYNKFPLSDEDIKKLQEIAEDYRAVKNYVYQRYGGIRSLSKIYPGYTVQKEMAKTKFREELALPSVYFNTAILDAVGDVKVQWSRTKRTVLKRVNANPNFSEDEKHYLRFVLKVNNAFQAVLQYEEMQLPTEVARRKAELSEGLNIRKLHNYLRRQVRNCHIKLYTKKAEGFSITERAYRYAYHGIYITMKEKRKRIFVELTDNNTYKRQIYVKLYPEEKNLKLLVPVDVEVKFHKDYTNVVGIAFGVYIMFTTDSGHVYGEKNGLYQIRLSEWIREQNIKYAMNRKMKSGRKKYTAKKHRMTEQLHSYINMELNRFLKTEKPNIIYIVKLPKAEKHGGNKAINHSMTLWQRGYIRKRLQQKCKEQSIEIVEVFGKNISTECSQCGAIGRKSNGIFTCPICGNCMDEKINTACNVKKRGEKSRFGYHDFKSS